MNRTILAYIAALLTMISGLSGCSKGANASDQASSSPVAAPSSTASATVSAPLTGSASVSTAPSGAETTASPAALSDIAGVNGEKEVTELAQLGVVDPTSGTFDPGAPIKRRDFIRWLVRANNALWSDTPTKLVKLADKTEASYFSDVSTSDPDFPYVQGMQDAGYAVGFPDKTFRPDQPLTREQMFAIKNVFDRGSVDSGLTSKIDYARNTVMPPWKDRQAISKTYVAAIATGSNGGSDSFGRVYGASSLFHPQMEVTRAQAAVLVSVEGDHVFYGGAQRTAAQALAASTPMP